MTVIDHKIIKHDKTLSNIKLSDLLKPNLPMKIHQHLDIYTFFWDGGVHSNPTLTQGIVMVHMDQSSGCSLFRKLPNLALGLGLGRDLESPA